VDRAAVS